MIYTTYMSNIKNIPEDSIKILITRWRPKNISFMKKDDILWRPNLAPTDVLLSRYKNEDIDWEEFRERFIDESFNNKMFIYGVQEIVELNEENDVYLICYEKEDIFCHRKILREILEYNGYESKEYRKDKN